MKNKFILGVTGPIASGKDEACRMLAKNGFLIINADREGHRILRDDQRCKAALVKAFGKEILAPSGAVSRKKLGGIVFGSRRALKILDAIVHPYLRGRIRHIIKTSKRNRICINAAVLKEIGFVNDTDRVMLLTASKGLRMKRLMRGRGMDRLQALSVIKSQPDDKAYLRISDITVVNNGTMAGLMKKIGKVLTGISS